MENAWETFEMKCGSEKRRDKTEWKDMIWGFIKEDNSMRGWNGGLGLDWNLIVGYGCLTRGLCVNLGR